MFAICNISEGELNECIQCFPFFFANFEHAFPYNISNKRPLRDVTHLSTATMFYMQLSNI